MFWDEHRQFLLLQHLQNFSPDRLCAFKATHLLSGVLNKEIWMDGKDERPQDLGCLGTGEETALVVAGQAKGWVPMR